MFAGDIQSLVGKPESMSIYAGLQAIYAILLGGRFVGWHIIRLAPTQEGEISKISQTLLLYICIYIYVLLLYIYIYLAKSPPLYHGWQNLQTSPHDARRTMAIASFDATLGVEKMTQPESPKFEDGSTWKTCDLTNKL